MPAVLVHGVPDTFRLWDGIRAALHRDDVITPSLPGFGGPLPPGFVPTKEAYSEWLVDELERAAADGPVDVVGHDWGALLVLRAISLRPDLVRTWCTGDGPIDSEYVWHATAQMWQTPEVGEQVIAAMVNADVENRVAAMVGAGVPEATAPEVVAHIDTTMGECILGLYRSAVTVGSEWEADLARVDRPGLSLWGAGGPLFWG